MSNQVYISWNPTVKLVWDLPRSTKNVLANHFRSAWQQILSQYIGFLKRLGKSVSSDVRILKNIVAQNIR